MDIQVKITEIGKPEFVPKGKNGYQKIVVKFEGDKGPQSRPFMSFDPIFSEVKDLAIGAYYDVTIEKKDNFWNWVSVRPAAKVVEVSAADKPRAQTTGTDWNAKNTLDRERFEFEKSVRQQSIIRQSQLSNAVAFYKGDDIPTLLNIAGIFVNWVNGEEPTEEESDAAPARSPGRPRKPVVVE